MSDQLCVELAKLIALIRWALIVSLSVALLGGLRWAWGCSRRGYLAAEESEKRRKLEEERRRRGPPTVTMTEFSGEKR